MEVKTLSTKGNSSHSEKNSPSKSAVKSSDKSPSKTPEKRAKPSEDKFFTYKNKKKQIKRVKFNDRDFKKDLCDIAYVASYKKYNIVNTWAEKGEENNSSNNEGQKCCIIF